MFLLDQNDGLYRLPNTTFERMLRDPTSHRIPRFAGARVRMTVVVVELLDRQPIRVIWITFGILTFDGEGCFDPSAFDRHQRARAELALAPLIAKSDGAATIVNAASRFVAHGGRWTPSRTLARRIDEAALGRAKCPRLSVSRHWNRELGKPLPGSVLSRRAVSRCRSQAWDRVAPGD